LAVNSAAEIVALAAAISWRFDSTIRSKMDMTMM
jgi:hypothetical protein